MRYPLALFVALLTVFSASIARAEIVLDETNYLRAEGLGEHDQLTLTLWLQPHGPLGDFNSVLHCDGWEIGDLHVFFTEKGQFHVALRGNKPQGFSVNQPLLDPSAKKWIHLAVVYDARAKTSEVYFDGK
ncbi:MAG: LamG domain-containing protein, partial [Rhodospirillales bacterium]|nr:LamG domain-containing protein [Rhodospirillales bacterium]